MVLDRHGKLQMDDRESVAAIHRHLRGLIVTNELPADAELNQLRISRSLGVSRGPIREALRMLQQEGLVTAEQNNRARVAKIRPADVEAAYVQRMLLETLGVRLTVPDLQVADLKRATALLAEAERKPDVTDLKEHAVAHRGFHMVLISHLPERLLAQVTLLFDATDRFRVAYATNSPRSWENARRDHHGLLDAARRNDADAASRLLAEHYMRTASTLLTHLAPDYDRRALNEAFAQTQHR
ncbi:MAG TPA: GntR family transcriptional regulator [Streptosporangiaceae bacterium]|jgi:DNA-binding GntR family transcriptional regulator